MRSGSIGTLKQVRFFFGHDMGSDPRFLQPETHPRAWLVDADIAGGGILMSSSIHFLSTVSFILDDPVANQVTARCRQNGRHIFPGIEDDVDLWIEYGESARRAGFEFALHESWAADVPFLMQFIGEDGYLTLSGPKWNELSIHGCCGGPLPASCESYRQGAKLAIPFPLPPETLAPGVVRPFFHGLIGDMVQSVLERRHVPRLPSARHARDMQRIISAAYLSGRQGVPAKIESGAEKGKGLSQ
jgi:predicted dehydrogenase